MKLAKWVSNQKDEKSTRAVELTAQESDMTLRAVEYLLKLVEKEQGEKGMEAEDTRALIMARNKLLLAETLDNSNSNTSK